MGTTPVFGFPYPDPSDLVANYPALGQQLAEDVETEILASGLIVQVINAQTSTEATNNTNVYADTGLTATITPTSATSKVLVLVSLGGVGKASSDTAVESQLLRGASVLILTSVFASLSSNSNQTGVGSITANYLDSPATTSATTYKMQFRSWANSTRARVQESSVVSTISLIEVRA
jgi:hypothetical protein